MIISSRMRSDIDCMVKRGMSNTRILNQILLDYRSTPYKENPHEHIAQVKDINKEINAQRAKHGGQKC